MKKTGIIILNWNNYEMTIDLINSILKIEDDLNLYDIYIVDNGSKDQSVAMFRNYINAKRNEEVVNIHLVGIDNNLGYAQGNNKGIKKAIQDGCDYILILNNDVILEKPILKQMVHYYNSTNNIGIITLKILNADYTIQKWCARRETKILHRFVIYSPFSRVLKWTKTYQSYFYDLDQYDQPFEIELFSGAAFLISTKNIVSLDYFDNNTFLYEEEVILAHKLQEKGLKIVMLPNLYILHQEGITTQKLGLKKYVYMIESEKYYIENYSTEENIFLKKKVLFALRKLVLIFKSLENMYLTKKVK